MHALAKARDKRHVPALWALNDRLIDTIERQGMLRLFKSRLAVSSSKCNGIDDGRPVRLEVE